MTGKPAARRDDKTLKGGPITQGSRNVLIGTAGGVACSTCPNGVAPEGNPVNPLLGAKIQAGEVDLALPGPMPFVVSRDYSSYQTDTPAPVGLLGPGWWLPTESSVLQTDDALTLNDTKGRSIRFEPLAPGESAFSRSESLWIVRGGLETLEDTLAFRLHTAWSALHIDDRRNPSLFFITNNPLGPWWIFGPNPPTGPLEGQRLLLLGLSDRFRQALHIQRDAAGVMTAVQDGAGRQYRLELKTLPHVANEGSGGWGSDSGQRLMAVYLSRDPHHPVLPKEPLVRYEYSPRGELAAVFGRDGSEQRRFQYDPRLPGRMTAHHYAGREPVSYVYNNDGKVIEQHRPGLLSYRFDYQAESTVVTDSLGRTRTYHFKGKDGLRRVVQLEHADGSTTQSRFDASGRLVASIDALGRETYFQLDVATGNLLSITLPDGSQSHWSSNEHGQVVEYTNVQGASQLTRYDQLGRLSQVTDGLRQTTRFHYADDQSEYASTIEDANGGKKHLAWTAMAQLASYTDCSGHTTHYRYDRWGQQVQVKGEEGLQTSFDYDRQGRLVTQTNAANQSTRYAYNPAGDLTAITAPDGNAVRFDRDALGRLRVYHYGDSLGLTQQYEFDNAGRLIRLTNENGAHTTFAYDPMDRLIEQINFDGRTQRYAYDMAGRLTQTNDAGQPSRLHYDKGDRLVLREVGDATNPYQEHFEYTRDGSMKKAWHRTELWGNTISVEFERDALGRITRETQLVIDAQGTEAWKHCVQRQFNPIGVESQTTYSGLPPIEWQTYGPGHLHGVVLDGQSLLHFERDKLHRETLRTFGQVQTTRSYDILSRLSHLETQGPQVGDDAIGSSLNRIHHYDLTGQLTHIDTAKGSHQYGYDKAGRLIEATQPGIDTQHYRFDPAGNRLFENQQIATAPEHWENTVRQRINDPQFNLLGTHHASDVAPQADRWIDNRILHDGEYHYDYDQWGNLKRKFKAEGNETHQYVYDSNHRLTQFALHSDTEARGANYHYDPFGRRVAKQVQHADKDGNIVGNLETTFFGWDGDRLVLTEKDKRQIHTLYEPNSFVPMIRIEGDRSEPKHTLVEKIQTQTSVTMPSELAAMFTTLEGELRRNELSEFSKRWMRESEMQVETLRGMLDDECSINGRLVHLYCCDHLGTPVALSNENGFNEWWISLDPWGKSSKEHTQKNIKQTIRLPGQHVESESNLAYNRHRYFDPNTSRYTTQDPIGLIGGNNFYSYANNPIIATDPLGLWAGIDDLIFSGGGAIAGLIGLGVSDIWSGSLSGWEDYTASAIGGAAGGETLLYAGPVAAGAVGGLATNMSKQLLKNLSGKQCGVDVVSTVVDTGIGAVTGNIKGLTIPGITSGRNSMNAIFKQMSTKFKNGTISSVTTKTASKMFVGRSTDAALVRGAAVGSLAGSDASGRPSLVCNCPTEE